MELNKIYQGDVLQVLKTMPDEFVNCVVTSPPYWGLRDYGVTGQIGLESTPEAFVSKMVEVFREVRRVLRKDGTLFLNLGDSYFSNGQAYGTADKSKRGFLRRDCSSENPCGERKGSSSNRNPDNICPVHGQTLSSFLKSLGYTVDQSGRFPNADSSREPSHTAPATAKTRPSFRRDRAPVSVLKESKKHESSQRHQAKNHQSDSSSSFQDGVSEKKSGDVASLDKTVCTCGIETLLGALNLGKSGNASFGSAYLDYTTTLLKPKDLVGIPWRVAFALQADGWYLRSDIIWSKPNPMPESVTDRPTKAHEYIFLLTKSAKYFYDSDAIKEQAIYVGITGMDDNGYKDAEKFNGKHGRRARQFGATKQVGTGRGDVGNTFIDNGFRNKRSVWTVATHPYAEAHFATFPEALIEPCVRAGSPQGGVVLDPFMGAGTTALVTLKQGRKFIGIELNPKYIQIAEDRIRNEAGLLLAI